MEGTTGSVRHLPTVRGSRARDLAGPGAGERHPPSPYCGSFSRATEANALSERASTVLTSNKGFEDWGQIFGDEAVAAAVIDRLVHHCHLVTIQGNSYRLREHTELWQALHAPQDPDSQAGRRRRSRQEVATI